MTRKHGNGMRWDCKKKIKRGRIIRPRFHLNPPAFGKQPLGPRYADD